MASIPTEQQISEIVHGILQTHDLRTITLRMVMGMLCDRFSLPKDALATHKTYVRSIINEFLVNNYNPSADGTESADGVSKQDGEEENGEVDANAEAEADEEEEEEDEKPQPAKRKAGRPRNSKRASNGKAAGPSSKTVKLTGLERPVVLAQPLADFFGEVVLPRSHIPKRISTYVKENKLQDPQDGRRILCDDALKTALNVDNFTFFSLAKLISGLVFKPDECDPELQEFAKTCEEKLLAEKLQKLQEATDSIGESSGKAERSSKKRKTSDKPRKPSAPPKPMQLSPALSAVVGEEQLPRPEVLKKIWVYIRENRLQDPNNGQQILCDDKLQAIFEGSQTVTNMGITKYLSAHMSKIEEG